METIRGSQAREGKTPVKIVSTKKVVATGFSLPSTSADVSIPADDQTAKQGYFIYKYVPSVAVQNLFNSFMSYKRMTAQNWP